MKKIVLLAFVLVLLSTTVVMRFIRPVVADGTISIRADGSVAPPTAPIHRDGNVYTFTDNINDSIVVERDNIVIDGAGYTLQGTGSGRGIDLSGMITKTRNNVTIKNMEIKAFSSGIWLYYSSNNSIYGNNITNNHYGVHLYKSSDNTISQNNITNNSLHNIELILSSNNAISGNNIANSNYGIILDNSLGNTISRNNINANDFHSIVLNEFSNYTTISGNNITPIKRHGIWLRSSSGNSISKNNINANDGYGVWLRSSSSNNISGNNITRSGSIGIYLESTSSGNSILGNNIADNFFGIEIRESSNNFVYHNNFVNNSNQVSTFNSTNVWDDGYPSGGNYWSNYTGVDVKSGPNQDQLGSDGIADTSYTIDANNTDRFPLMGSINFFKAGTWNETTYYVHTVSNSTVSDFNFNPDNYLISFNVTGPDYTVGFCRITIPNALLWCDKPEQWQVWVNNTLIEDRKIMEDTHYTYIYFTYNQSTQNVEVIGVHVIPEFPTWTSMLLILIVLTVAIAIYKRRLLKTPIH